MYLSLNASLATIYIYTDVSNILCQVDGANNKKV